MLLSFLRLSTLLTSMLLSVCVRAEISIKAPGAPAALMDNVRAHLALSGQPCDVPKWRISREFSAIDRQITPALRALGYYNAKIVKKLTYKERCWDATVDIELGEPVRVSRIDIELIGGAETDHAFTQILENLPLKKGQVLHHGKYEKIKTTLRNQALESGYLDAKLDQHTLRVNPKTLSAEVLIKFNSGQRYRFEALRFNPQPLDEEFVRRLAGWEVGESYTAGSLIDLDRRLSDAGYFSQVDVRPLVDEAHDHSIPIDVTLAALPRHSWRAGIGYATDTGPRLTFGYDNRRVTTNGHRFSSELKLSPVESGLNASYILPGTDPHRETYTLETALEHEDTDSSVSDRALLAGRWLIKHGVWTESRFIELLHEQSEIGDDDVEATLLMPGTGWTYLKSDDPLRTNRGLRLSFEVRGAHEGLLSSATLLQFRASIKGIYRFGNAGRITARSEFGTTLVDDFFALPASLRFFAGGDNSVRGYAYRSLGPKDSNGDVVGGKHLLTAGLEYEHPIVGNDWWLGAFIDAGNAYDNDFTVLYGYGFGVRWYSPIGRLKVDLAFPSDTRDDSWRLHFSLGADL